MPIRFVSHQPSPQVRGRLQHAIDTIGTNRIVVGGSREVDSSDGGETQSSAATYEFTSQEDGELVRIEEVVTLDRDGHISRVVRSKL